MRTFQQALAPLPHTYPLIPELNPRKINMNPVWSGKVPVKTFLEQQNQRTTGVIEGLSADGSK